MANSNVASLGEEVADLLRHDNLDVRIQQWILMAWNDLCQRAVTDLNTAFTKVTVASGSSATLSSVVGTMRAVIAVESNGTLSIPRELSPVDYSRLSTQDNASTGSPMFWCIDVSGSTVKFKVWPPVSSSTDYTLLWSGNPLTTVPAGTDHLPWPYHYESIIIWGAAAYGALALDRSLYPVFTGEYEQLMQDFFLMTGYRMDSLPILRSITGPYAQTPRMSAPPRIPDTIQ